MVYKYMGEGKEHVARLFSAAAGDRSRGNEHWLGDGNFHFNI